MKLVVLCPRCGGRMMREDLLGAVELACLQCGNRIDAENRLARLSTVEEEPSYPVAA